MLRQYAIGKFRTIFCSGVRKAVLVVEPIAHKHACME